VEDPNTIQDVLDKFNTFKIVVVWELDFVKIVTMSKILNNKDCKLSTKPLYCESLSHVCQIWISYDRPIPNLDGSMHHSEKYKVSYLSPFQEVISVLEIYLWSLLMVLFLLLYNNLRRCWSLCSTLNLLRNPWVFSFFWTWFSTCGRWFLLNGKIATFQTRLEMCQLIFQYQLKNQCLVAFRIWEK